MATRVMDVSPKLAEYIMQGWIPTSRPCTTPDCPGPLMLPPAGRATLKPFCVACDQSDSGPSRTDRPASPSTVSPATADFNSASTPPTDLVPSRSSSPELVPPPVSEESRLRREQSDRASQEIGTRLLKGWAMLADECPNETCWGVPLVRPPKQGGKKDPRKECVICRTVYVDEEDASGWTRLTPLNKPTAGATPSAPAASSTSAIPPPPPAREPSPKPAAAVISTPSRARSPPPLRPTSRARREAPVSLSSSPSTLSSLERTLHSLHKTLDALTKRLDTLCEDLRPGDAVEIGELTSAINNVVQSLGAVRSAISVEKLV